jgi:hypothetical protein
VQHMMAPSSFDELRSVAAAPATAVRGGPQFGVATPVARDAASSKLTEELLLGEGLTQPRMRRPSWRLACGASSVILLFDRVVVLPRGDDGRKRHRRWCIWCGGCIEVSVASTLGLVVLLPVSNSCRGSCVVAVVSWPRAFLVVVVGWAAPVRLWWPVLVVLPLSSPADGCCRSS